MQQFSQVYAHTGTTNLIQKQSQFSNYYNSNAIFLRKKEKKE